MDVADLADFSSSPSIAWFCSSTGFCCSSRFGASSVAGAGLFSIEPSGVGPTSGDTFPRAGKI